MEANKKEFHFFKNEQSEKNHLIKKIVLFNYDLKFVIVLQYFLNYNLIKQFFLLIYFFLKSIEAQSQILTSILLEASLRTLNNVSEDLENAISNQIKDGK